MKNKLFKKKILHRSKYRGIKELDIIFERQLVTEGGMIMVEHDRFMIFTDDYLNQRLSVKKYGQSYLSIWLV